MRSTIFSLFLLFLPVAAAAQGPAAAQREAMKKLEFLAGEWRGEGWTEFSPGQRRTSGITETAQFKLGGTVLLIEGLGKTTPPGRQEEVVVHHALAVVSYDPATRLFRMKSYLADGRSVDAEAKFTDGGFQWYFTAQGMSIRYTVHLTEKGEWSEKGEMSQDGTSWRQFHGMTLQRVK